MREKPYKSLGCVVKLLVPETVKEYDNLAKKEGAALDSAIDNAVYRGALADFRDEFTTEVEKQTGVERATKVVGKRKDNGEDILAYVLSEADYIKSVCTEKKWEPGCPQLQSIADSIAAKITFDPSEKERKSKGPKKIPQKFVVAATKMFDNNKHEAWASKLQITLSGDRNADIQLMAAAIKADVERQQEEMLAGMA